MESFPITLQRLSGPPLLLYGEDDEELTRWGRGKTPGILAISRSGGNVLLELSSIVTKRTEILIEFDELVVINAYEDNDQRCCSNCGGKQPLVTPSLASRILGVSVRTINRWVEADAVHFVETPNGSLLVCIASIVNSAMSEANLETGLE